MDGAGRLTAGPEKRTRQGGGAPARCCSTVGVAGLHGVGHPLHLVTKQLELTHVLLRDRAGAGAQLAAVLHGQRTPVTAPVGRSPAGAEWTFDQVCEGWA